MIVRKYSKNRYKKSTVKFIFIQLMVMKKSINNFAINGGNNKINLMLYSLKEKMKLLLFNQNYVQSKYLKQSKRK